jgi:hypothetical protein
MTSQFIRSCAEKNGSEGARSRGVIYIRGARQQLQLLKTINKSFQFANGVIILGTIYKSFLSQFAQNRNETFLGFNFEI